MLEQFADFHFIRPVWLLLVLSALVLYVLIKRRENVRENWGKFVAPHLLEHLIVGKTEGWRIRPVHLASMMMFLAGIALAGPTWERELPPFTEDKAPLVVVLDLSQSMDAIDVQPTRLERAKQKIRDLLGLRLGSRNALFVYSGDAHMVLPLTEDPSIMELFLSSLSTDLMPEEGNDASAALKSAQNLLVREDVPGTILFVTDGIERKDFAAFLEHNTNEQDQLLVLGVGTSQGGPITDGDGHFLTDDNGRRIHAKLDLEGLRALSDETGTQVTTFTIDDDDVTWIQRSAQSHLQVVQQAQAQTRWRDFGYYLVFPIALLTALWFRRGWTVRWAAGLLLAFALSNVPSAMAQSVDTQVADSSVSADSSVIEIRALTLWEEFLGLWLTADQQGRYFFEKQEYALAAERFEDAYWKGISLYHNSDFETAVNQFALHNTSESLFLLGNCYARLNDYEEAVVSYEDAIEQRPEFAEATANRDLVAALIEAEKKKEEEEGEPGDPNLDPDEIKFDDKGKKGKEGKVEFEIKPEQMAEIWMRNIQTTPADFLRLKFLKQSTTDD